MIDWNKRNGGFLDDFNVMNYQVSNLSQQIDKLNLELQRKDNNWNELKEFILNHYIVGHKVQNGTLDQIMLKMEELEENN